MPDRNVPASYISKLRSYIIGFAGYSGAGKTTYIEKLIPLLRQQHWRVAVIKHAHHAFDIDTPGKDSYRHRQAGAEQVVIRSDKRWVYMQECENTSAPTLEDSIARLQPCDIVIVEGCRSEYIPKVEVWRAQTGHPRLAPNDPSIIAVLTDTPLPGSAIPVYDLAKPEDLIAQLIFPAVSLGSV